ncbi:hypothetical protein K3495_g15387 [Podosphaera aphanis]|nr:hypothetical protein K3495_g15387 [Podosphaera aphanis]
MKTCSKHRNPAPKLKKHPRTELEQWDSFFYEIKTWNQDQKQDVRYTFDLDKLPVNFGVSVEINDNDNSEFRQQHQTVGVLVDNIHEADEHRFPKLRTKKAIEHEYDYCCCQDSARIRKRETLGKRDRLQMKRYRCNSKLSIKPDLINRRLTVVLRHKYRAPYVNIRLSTAALAFVAESDVESEILNESSDENSESPEDYADDVISTMRFLLEHLEKQKELGNTKFLEVFKANNTKNWELAAEIKQRERKKIHA